MAAKLLLIVACLALSHAALVKRDAPATSSSDDLQKNALDFFNTFKTQIDSLVHSKSAEDVNKAVKDGANTVAEQLSTFATSLDAAIKDTTGKVKEQLESSKASLQRTAEDLRKSHPEVEQQATALKDRLTSAVQTAAQESQKLAEEIKKNVEETNAKLAPTVKEAFDNFVKQTQEVQKKIHEAATKQ